MRERCEDLGGEIQTEIPQTLKINSIKPLMKYQCSVCLNQRIVDRYFWDQKDEWSEESDSLIHQIFSPHVRARYFCSVGRSYWLSIRTLIAITGCCDVVKSWDMSFRIWLFFSNCNSIIFCNLEAVKRLEPFCQHRIHYQDISIFMSARHCTRTAH